MTLPLYGQATRMLGSSLGSGGTSGGLNPLYQIGAVRAQRNWRSSFSSEHMKGNGGATIPLARYFRRVDGSKSVNSAASP